MKKIQLPIYLLIFISGLLLISGCTTVKHLPANIFEEEHDLSVDVTKFPPKPRMRDSGKGGLIGLVVNAGRASKMKKIFDGIEGETVKELLRQQVRGELESVFYVDEERKDLALEINIVNWGWFVPSTVLGIKTGAYQLEIVGNVTVYNLNPGKEKIAFNKNIMSQKPLGNDPNSSDTQKMLIMAIEDFSDQVSKFVFHNKP